VFACKVLRYEIDLRLAKYLNIATEKIMSFIFLPDVSMFHFI